MKNLRKCNILYTFALKNNREFAEQKLLERLSFWSLASTIFVLSLERVCSQKVGPGPRIVFSP